MNAIVSGQAQTALLINGDKFSSFDINVPDVLVTRRETDIRFLFGEAKDLRLIENTNYEDVLKQLQFDFDKTSTLDLTLLLLDNDVSNAKQEISEALEELFEDQRLIIYLESIFYAKPLPIDADIERALVVCERNAEKVYRFLSTLKDKQEDIRKITEIWSGISIEVFGSNEIRADFQSVFVHEGIFHEAVIYCRDSNRINYAFVKAGINQSINSLPNHRAVLQEFFNPLRKTSAPRETIKPLRGEIKQGIKERYKVRRRVNREVIRDNALSQIEYIANLLIKRDIETARIITNELIEYQLKRGERIHVVKSLCSIAQSAKELVLYKFQLELAEKSIELLYTDAWAQAQYGDALLRNNRFFEASKAFENAISFISDNPKTKTVAKTGYAEVLKAKGQLNESQKIYQQIIAEYPDDVVAKNGYAEVLKAKGQLNESQKIYQQTMLDYPDDIFAKTGYAEVLKAKGQLNESQKIYQQIMLDYPDDIFAKTGYAEVLKAKGQLNESQKIYQQTMLDYPDDVVAKNGYAEILKAKGQLNESQKIYQQIIDKYPENIFAKTGYAEVLKAKGQLNESQKIYQQIIAEYPDDIFAKNGYAEVLKAKGQLNESQKIYQQTMLDYPDDIFAKTGYAEVLKAKGQLNESQKIYQQIIDKYPENIVAKNGYAEILKAKGQLNESQKIYQQTMLDYPENIFAKTGYAEVLKAKGQLNESQKIYQQIIDKYPENIVAKNGYAEILKAKGQLNESQKIYQQTMLDYPENIFAKTGYAEVLKAKGQLNESQKIYQQIIDKYPENIVAKNGFCSVLFALGRFNEVLERLQSENLISVQNWVGYHIRGMALLRLGRIDEAITVFEYGEVNDPFPASKEYFRSALAIAQLKQGDFKKANDLLEKVTSPLLQPKTNILRLHVFGELKEFEKAEVALTNYEVATADNVIAGPWLRNEHQLVAELKHRYISRLAPSKSNEWVFEREVELLALAP